ncbi:MAG TPA: uroporphyrinogen decarboxylase family protein, partial [Spirochaetia bacterium]|nr:uroporphyrinogen decarboxylase family protein [Spirochaetia bacterium]
MTHRDRVATALEHERPDRCPMQASFTPEFAERLCTELGVAGSELHNPHGGGNSHRLETLIGEDLLLTSIGWANSYYSGAERYVDEWGVGWHRVPYETPFGRGSYTEISSHPLADVGMLAAYRAPDPSRPDLCDEAKRTIEGFGREYWIVGVAVTTIFETAWALRGLEQLLTDFVVDPELAETILDIPYSYHRTVARRLTEAGVDMIWTGDDFGAQHSMIISPQMWRRFFKPRMAELFADLKGINSELKIAYHSDGNIEAIIPDLIEIGLDVLNPVQPGSMSPSALRRTYGKRLAFWGTIDEQNTLPFGSSAQVRAEVAARLEEVGSSGGLI